MIRVAFCGASGTGKSTLADSVINKYNFLLNPVGSRSVSRSMGFAAPYDVDAAGQRDEFQRKLFEQKRDWEKSHDSFVSDRASFDNLVYATMHGARMKLEEIGEYVDAMHRYTHVVYCPVASFHRLGDDPARVKEIGYHHMFDLLLRALLAEYQTPCITLGHEDRAEHVERYLSGTSSVGTKFVGYIGG